ncbi:MAG: transglycosylase SLT domain-containing protein [Deltaproteobacteria bacterium]|nr:transglycosylase SLT domain-containing protein [Deltaproteobacteria bacterium]MBI3295993.1 transglycosylase SLT domain-containing protein [Deltaproteobacteria bacterium]
MKRLFSILILLPSWALATVGDLTPAQMYEVVRLSRLIAFSQPNLPSQKYFEYAYGINVASLVYGIDPVLLIAITHQETSFRENLPVGRAGEIGICQIRKAWLRNPAFIKEFGRAKVADLRNPIKSFLFAAWILRDLKALERPSRTLPFWCYYNSTQFENRLKYFLSVNKSIVMLRRNEPLFGDRSLASVRLMAKQKKHSRLIANKGPIHRLTSAASFAD